MTPTIDATFRRLFELRDRKFLKSLGRPGEFVDGIGCFACVGQIESSETLEAKIHDGTLDFFLNDQRNVLFDVARQVSQDCVTALSDISQFMKPGIESEFGAFEIEGLDNSLQGFGPSIYVSIAQWVFMCLAQEQTLAVDFDGKPPGVFESMMQVFEAGHFPCAWEQMPTRGRLWIY